MAGQQASSAAKSLAKAQQAFKNPKSQLHRKIHKSLVRLAQSHTELLQAFDQRTIKRDAEISQFKRETMETAEHALKQQRQQMEQLKRGQLTTLIESLETVADMQMQTAKTTIAWRESVASSEAKIDAGLVSWIDRFTARSADALFSDSAAEDALVLLSGGLVLAGLSGGLAAIGAAIASAMIVANDVRTKVVPKGRVDSEDQKTARTEIALTLIDCAADLTDKWLAIIKPR